jgi:DNA-binding NarL/FixJ family response regulator
MIRVALGGRRRGLLRRARHSLAARETEVLELLACSVSNAGITDTLVLSETTVKTHVAAVLAKLRLWNRAQAAVVGYESGWFALDLDSRAAG